MPVFPYADKHCHAAYQDGTRRRLFCVLEERLEPCSDRAAQLYQSLLIALVELVFPVPQVEGDVVILLHNRNHYGTYDVLLESNWPVVKRMLDASRREAEPFNPFDLDSIPPELLKVTLEARIEQTRFLIRMSMYPKGPGAVIKQSNTIATLPLSDVGSGHKGLIYVFEQENDSRAPTDDERHLGAARLTIDRSDHSRLSGEYWNNRAWRRGVNAAGRLTLVRSSSNAK